MAQLAKGVRVTGDDRHKLASSLRARYDRGESIRTLATDFNRSYGFIHRLLMESGGSMRSRGGATRGRGALGKSS